MLLPKGFQFSQGNLQDYVDCPKRFLLRHLRRLAWPAVEVEPQMEQERWLLEGQQFHHLAQQAFTGLPLDRLSDLASGKDLQGWWASFTDFYHQLVAEPGLSLLLPEVTLSAPLAGYRLLAKCDLITIASDGQVTIYDWKTSRQRTGRSSLEKHLQSRVYPYVVTRAGAHLAGSQEIDPGQVTMIYWFSSFPDRPERLAYSREKYQADEQYLGSLIQEIQKNKEADFHMTANPETSRFCVYRSLCNRGVQAGEFDEAGEVAENSLQLDFEQAVEVEF